MEAREDRSAKRNLVCTAGLPAGGAPASRSGGPSRVGGSVLAGRRGSLAEAVLEATGHVLQVPHAARSGRAAALRLNAPVELAHLRSRIAARRASLLLDVIRALAAPGAEHVRLAVVHTFCRRTLRHFIAAFFSADPSSLE